MKEGFDIPGGGSERTLGSVGGGKNILDRDCKYFIKSYVSLY